MTKKATLMFCLILMTSVINAVQTHRLSVGYDPEDSAYLTRPNSREVLKDNRWLGCAMERCLSDPSWSDALRYTCIQICKDPSKMGVAAVNNAKRAGGVAVKSEDPYGCIGFLCHLSGVNLKAIKKDILKRPSGKNNNEALNALVSEVLASPGEVLLGNTGKTALLIGKVNQGGNKDSGHTFDSFLCAEVCSNVQQEDFMTCFQRNCQNAFSNNRNKRGNTAAVNNKREDEKFTGLILPREKLERLQKKWVPRVSCLEANCDQFKHNTESLFQCGVQMCGEED